MALKLELLHGGPLEDQKDLLCKIYELAEQLLRKTTHENGMFYYINKWHNSAVSSIKPIEIASKLGIVVGANIEGYGRYDEEIILKKMKERNLNPNIQLVRAREACCTAEIEMRKGWDDKSHAMIYYSPINSKKGINYTIARGIAKIYFAIPEEKFSSKFSKNDYLSSEWIYDTKEEITERIFAYALVTPEDLIRRLEEDYRNDATRWPIDMSDWYEYLSDHIYIPVFQVAQAWCFFKMFQALKYN